LLKGQWQRYANLRTLTVRRTDAYWGGNLLAQAGLFDNPSLYIVASLKAAMNRAVRDTGISREQIIDKMTELAERDGIKLTNGNAKSLSLDVFEKWLNPQASDRVIPLKALPYFCAAVKSPAPLDVIVRPLGLRVIGEKEINQLEWAKASLEVKAARRRMRKLEDSLDD
jgi:hypothetical protein